MKTFVRILICLAVAVVAVTMMVFVQRDSGGSYSNALTGAVGTLFFFLAWTITSIRWRK